MSGAFRGIRSERRSSLIIDDFDTDLMCSMVPVRGSGKFAAVLCVPDLFRAGFGPAAEDE